MIEDIKASPQIKDHYPEVGASMVGDKPQSMGPGSSSQQSEKRKMNLTQALKFCVGKMNLAEAKSHNSNRPVQEKSLMLEIPAQPVDRAEALSQPTPVK